MTNESKAERAAREAAEWHARLNVHRVDQITLNDFFEWRRVPGNSQAYETVERLWDDAARLGDSRDVALAVRDALARPRWQRRLQAIEGAIRRKPLVAVLAAMVLALLIAGGSVLSQRGTRYGTAVGEQRLVPLADGSTIRLDTATQLRVRLGRHAREVDLIAGQALFQVAHDPDRPFVVHAAGAEVQDVGTRFNLRTDDQGGLRIALIEGRVRLTDRKGEAAPLALSAGQGSTFHDGAWGPALSIDTEDAASWSTGRLHFSDVPLTSAVTEMNRYLTTRIMLADHATDAIRVSGTFDPGDASGFVAAMCTLYHLKASTQPDGTILISG